MSSNVPALQERRFSIAEIGEVSRALAVSGLFGIKTPEQALALALVADAEGLHPATIAQDYDVIQGKPARKTHSVLARFQAAGGKVEWLALTDDVAKAEFSHPKGGAVVIEWTIKMAERARLVGKDNWRMYPRAMLRSRCIGEGVRAVFPAALGGALLVEEAQDLDPITVDASSGEITGGPSSQAPAFEVKRKPKAPAAEVVDVKPTVEQSPTDPTPKAPHKPAPASTEGGADLIEPGQVEYLKKKAGALGFDLAAVLERMGGLVLERLTKADFALVKSKLMEAGQ